MHDSISFHATVERVPSDGGWHIVRLPDDILKALRVLAEKNGNIPITATIGRTTWQTTIMSMGQQHWFLAVSAAVRKAENLSEGDTVFIAVSPDQRRLKNAS